VKEEAARVDASDAVQAAQRVAAEGEAARFAGLRKRFPPRGTEVRADGVPDGGLLHAARVPSSGGAREHEHCLAV